MIKMTVFYDNQSTESFFGVSFQQGDMSIVLKTIDGGHIAIPTRNVKAYRVDRHETEEDQTEEPNASVGEGEAENEVDPKQETETA